VTDTPASIEPQPDLPPPPKPRNRWKVVAIVLGVLIAVFVLLAIIGSRAGDNRDEKLAEVLPASIEENFQDKGIDVTVESVSCEKLPTTDATFSIICDVRIAGIDEIIETTVQGTVDNDFVQIDEVFSEERLLSQPKAIEYVQALVDQLTSGVTVLECDLGGDVAVIRTGSEFTCALDSGETVLVSVAADGSGQITDVFQTQQ
jgi:hypothetical protein